MFDYKKNWEGIDKIFYEKALYEYENMDKTTKKLLDSFISYVLQERSSDSYTSYGIKNRLEWVIEMEDCISNEQVKGAMLAKGFLPICSRELNWCFSIGSLD